jgi:hypothetical protein
MFVVPYRCLALVYIGILANCKFAKPNERRLARRLGRRPSDEASRTLTASLEC